MNARNEAARLARAHHHELRNASACSGAIVGAVVGLTGGLAGSVAAGLLGLIIGGISGLVLEKEDRRTARRQRELDRVIGVTSRNLGAAEAAARGAAKLAARTRERESSLLTLSEDIDHAPPPTSGAPAAVDPIIEPACPDCVAVRSASADTVPWCARHAAHHPHAILHYEYPQPFALGALLVRPDR